MHDPHRYPRRIFANHLIITSIIISHEDSFVYLVGLYGSTANGEIHTIEIESDFDTLHSLLAELAEDTESDPDMAARAEEVIEQLAHVVAHPTDDNRFMILEEGPLYFYQHVFALALVDEESEEGAAEPKEPSYVLQAYIDRAPEWPHWEEDWYPQDRAELPAYYNRALVFQYGIFLAFSDRLSRPQALHLANLQDPLLFAMAKLHFELLAEEKKNSSEEDYDS